MQTLTLDRKKISFLLDLNFGHPITQLQNTFFKSTSHKFKKPLKLSLFTPFYGTLNGVHRNGLEGYLITTSKAGHAMKWTMVWNERRILVWNVKGAQNGMKDRLSYATSILTSLV